MSRIREVNSSNIAEFLYESGNGPGSDRGLGWRLKMRIKFWFRKRVESYIMTNQTRKFLLTDLRELKYSDYYMKEKGHMTLRYVNKAGNLMTRNYRVRYTEGYFILAEKLFDSPYPGKKTKGPLKFKDTYHFGSELYCLGMIRCKEWWIPMGSCI